MKQTFKFISLLLLLIIQQGGQAKVILVHGTYSTTKDWFLPEGGFCKKLLEKNPTKNEQVIYIKWDGAPNSLSRLEGSEKLAHIILKLHTQSTIKTGKETLSLIGHSHGGSVINLACNLLEFARSEITENTMQELCEELLILSLIEYDLASVARAISEKYKSSLNLLTKKLKLKKGFIKNHTDLINALVSQVVLHKPHQETVDTYKIKIKSIIESLQKQAVGKLAKDKKLVENVFLMATPINMVAYAPCPEIVKKTFLFYSRADIIQNALGLYKNRTYPKNQQLWNLQTLVAPSPSTQKKYHRPSHNDFFEPFFGAGMMSIPELVKNSKKHVSVVFFEDGSTPELF